MDGHKSCRLADRCHTDVETIGVDYLGSAVCQPRNTLPAQVGVPELDCPAEVRMVSATGARITTGVGAAALGMRSLAGFAASLSEPSAGHHTNCSLEESRKAPAAPAPT